MAMLTGQDFLRCVRARADRVGAEDRERLLLWQALVDFFLGCERAADQDMLCVGDQARDAVLLLVRLRLGHENTGTRVAEVLTVGPLDPHPDVARLPSAERLRAVMVPFGACAGRLRRAPGRVAVVRHVLLQPVREPLDEPPWQSG
jgi:hypothetical protein